MPRNESVEDIIQAAAERVAQKVVPAVQRALAGAAASASSKRRSVVRRSAYPRRRPPRGEMTRWVADNRARRVPTFVIEATGLDTKKRIVAKFGANVTFEKGKPLPPVAANAGKSVKAPKPATAAVARVVKAKPPIIRKAAR